MESCYRKSNDNQKEFIPYKQCVNDDSMESCYRQSDDNQKEFIP